MTFQTMTESVNRWAIALIGFSLLCSAGFLWWISQRDNATPFLPAIAPAHWIVYPTPPDTKPHLARNLSATFRHSFELQSIPGTARLSVRAFNQGTVEINKHRVDLLLS